MRARPEAWSLVHLSGPRAGETTRLERLPASIGSGPESDLVIAGLAPRHCVLFQRDGEVLLLDSGSEVGTFLGGQPVQEAPLRDGDVIELGPGGTRLRFRREGAALPAALPDRQHGRRMSDTMAVRMIAHTSRSFRRMVVLLLVVTLPLLAWSWRQSTRLQDEVTSLRAAMLRAEHDRQAFQERVDDERRRGEASRRQLEKKLEEFKAREHDLTAQLADATSDEVQHLRGELEATRDRIHTLEDERAAGEMIIRRYGAGVCLIQGAYSFQDSARRPLRVQLDEAGRPQRETDGSLALGTDGEGPPHTVDYYGTGFLVDGRGFILTNRHVAEPWWNDATAEQIQRNGFQPQLLYLRGYFPQRKEHFDLALERTAGGVDLALLRTNLRGTGIPVLPLARSQKSAIAGQPVVVVGYPAGLEAILAKADAAEVQQILQSHGTDSQKVTQALSTRGLIRPSTTQGHIGDITRTDIVFDAPTTQGGSGGPVFNKRGEVIAVEYAVLEKFGGNSFGIPIVYALALLEEALKSAGA